MRQLGVAGVQMEVFKGDSNLERIADRLAKVKAHHPWVELVLFSELAVFGPEPKYAEAIPGPATEALRGMAREHGLWLVPGSLHEPDGRGGTYNTSVVINPEGEILTTYRKMFPWQPRERSTPGTEFRVFEIPGKAKVGLCICYDQWFPEFIRQLVFMGAEVILHPVMTPTRDRPLELVLSRANAIFSQSYFVSVNGLGAGGNGASMVVDPEGRILHQAAGAETIMAHCLDLDLVARVRDKGTLGLCRTARAFENRPTGFPVYERDFFGGGD